MCTRTYLDRQIQAINPKVVVTLGRYSMGLFLPNAKISSVHGQAMQVKGRLVVPMYHPAAALHQQSLKPVVEADFLRLPNLISSAGDAPEVSDDEKVEHKEEPKQLNLF
jgi:DNA polymerase